MEKMLRQARCAVRCYVALAGISLVVTALTLRALVGAGQEQNTLLNHLIVLIGTIAYCAALVSAYRAADRVKRLRDFIVDQSEGGRS